MNYLPCHFYEVHRFLYYPFLLQKLLLILPYAPVLTNLLFQMVLLTIKLFLVLNLILL